MPVKKISIDELIMGNSMLHKDTNEQWCATFKFKDGYQVHMTGTKESTGAGNIIGVKHRIKEALLVRVKEIAAERYSISKALDPMFWVDQVKRGQSRKCQK